MVRKIAHRDSVTGFSLVEVLIAMTVLGLFMTVISVLFVTGYRTFTQGTERTQTFRSMTVGLDRITREVRQTDHLYSPLNPLTHKVNFGLLESGNGYKPIIGGHEPEPLIVHVTNAYDTTVIREYVGFILDDSSTGPHPHSVLRYVYDNNTFVPTDPTTWVPVPSKTKAIAIGVATLIFRYFPYNAGAYPSYPNGRMMYGVTAMSATQDWRLEGGKFFLSTETTLEGK